MPSRSMIPRSLAATLVAILSACAADAPKAPTAPLASTTAAPSLSSPAPGRAALAGVVRAADGKPIDGALVAIVPAGGGEPVEAASDVSHDGGSFRVVGLTPGPYAITATAPSHTGAYVDAFELRADEIRDGIEVKLGGEGVTIRGTALDANKHPLRDTTVRASRISPFSGDTFITRADASGAFSVTVPKAEYVVSAGAPAHDGTIVNVPVGKSDVAITLSRAFPKEAPAPEEVVRWIRATSVPLTTVEAEHGFADMAPIRDMVGSARVVSLGEATHGTREFFQLKHRLFEYLVTEMGFDVFAIEASFPDARVVNDYVLHGKGDPGDAIAGMEFWTWDTEEVLALVTWMRRYNQDPKHARKLRFHGFDMQFPVGSARALLAYLREVDPKRAREDAKGLGAIDDAYTNAVLTLLPQGVRDRTITAIEEIQKRLEDRKIEYVKKKGETAWKLARLHAATAYQGVSIPGKPGDYRDRSMAENALAILDLEGPASKMVLWAHNGHVTRAGGDTGHMQMGGHLHRALGKDQVIFGFAFDHGSFQANELPFEKGRGLMTFTAPPAPQGSLDGALAKAGPLISALDLRRAPPGSAAAEWLGAKLYTRSIGSGYSDAGADTFFMPDSPSASYDALLFVAETTAARAKPTGRRGRTPEPPPPHAFTNGTFEDGKIGDVPDGYWMPPQKPRVGYRVMVSEEQPKEGKRCGMILRDPSPWPNAAGSLAHRVDPTPYRGKRVRLSASVRADVREIGNEAHLQLRSGAAFASTHDRPITSKAWETRDLEIDVPTDATVMTFALTLAGTGRAWIDDVSITVLGDAVKAPKR